MALALSGLRIWKTASDALEPGRATLRIAGERILAIGPGIDPDPDGEVIALDGATALPGLIDAHVHMTLDPEIRTPAEQLAVAPDALFAAMAARARAMLEAGITSARDLGGGAWRELELRDRIADFSTPGPRLLCAGQPVTSPKGHCWFWGGEARGEDEVRGVVRRQVARGADLIKVMATGGVLTAGTKPSDPQFEQHELDAIVAEARAHGRHTAAHCHGTSGIERAALAGARTIEHCSFATDDGFGSAPTPELVALLASAGSYVSPTVNTGFARFFAEDGSPGKFATRMGEAYTRLRRAGVPFIASTDAGIPNVAHHRLPEALAVFARLAGLRPVEALRAATSECARALGLEGVTGELRAGMCADVLVVDGNPLEDLSALLRPILVVARGRVVRR
ncbi:MAG: amidohydrolase family protein [Myxococcota bacterium]